MKLKPAVADEPTDATNNRKSWADLKIQPDQSVNSRVARTVISALRFSLRVDLDAVKAVYNADSWFTRLVSVSSVIGSALAIANDVAEDAGKHTPIFKKLGYSPIGDEALSALSELIITKPKLFTFQAMSVQPWAFMRDVRVFKVVGTGIVVVFGHIPDKTTAEIPGLYSGYEKQVGETARFIASHFWMDGDNLDCGWGNGTLKTWPMPAMSDYIGEPCPVDLAAKVRQRNGKTGVLIVGPSGEGKTTLARQVCHQLGKKRVLRFSGASNMGNGNGMMALINSVKPDAVIIDDMQDVFGERSYPSNATPSEVLNTFERVNAAGVLLFGTIMEDDPDRLAAIEARLPGALYYSGLRPGRFDVVVTFKVKNEEERFNLLRHYAASTVPDDVVKAVAAQCEGLTGAFLKGLAESLTDDLTHGEESVKMLLCMCPSKGAFNKNSFAERG